MDSSACKLYHVDGFDSREFLETYFSHKPEMVFGEDSLIFPIENLTKTFTAGHIKGEILIDLSTGPIIHHLYAACEFFKHIIVLKATDRCIMELKRWLDTRTGAFNWGHATQLHVDTEGNRDQLQVKEEKMRSAIQHVIKCDFEKENIIEPLDLPPADCIISAGLLDLISKDHNDYKRHLGKFSRMLNPGGHIILIGDLDAIYIRIGKNKMHFLRYDEDFARKALAGEGFVIDCCKVKETKVVSDLCDYKGIIFIAAHKGN
ncbi:nicotinamide N-methyltransferase-like [Eleutherodactylus coqui]|uniref:nicotinamide N-methyltransferase-like n=1 Tax=Eleutherodactylus coqui TaxID=57060 RepID=UPI003461A94D